MNRRRLALALAALLLALPLWAATRAHLVDPRPTVLLRDRQDRFLGEVPDPAYEGRGYWIVEPLPERVVAATLALEDRRFRDHPGVDPIAVGRAVMQNVEARRVVSGASTLAMQVARMQAPADRTPLAKAVEATTAVLLTARHGRDAVLAQYLRLAPYGNGIHGIGYAARRYLDKPVADLSWAETAFLCALPQAPSKTNPFRPEGRKRAVARARRILDVLLAQGVIEQVDYDQAQLDLGRLRIPDRGTRPEATLHAVLRLGEDPPEGPLVRTSLDLALQERVQDDVAEAVRAWEARGAGNAAVMVVDATTGEVHAAVGSTGYFRAEHAGSIDYTRVARNPGSTLKPFFYAAALEQGLITPATVLDDLGRSREGIENADDTYLGPLLPRQALGNSRNVPAVDVLGRLGLEPGYGVLRALGLHHDALPAAHYGLGLAIGGLPVTLSDLVQATSTLAGDGRLRALSWEADRPGELGARVFSEGTARTVTTWLADPMARLPSFPRMGATELPFPAAVKTGTSTDFRDAWTIAWSPRWIVGVWVGDPGNVPMARLSGFTAAAELAHDVLIDLHGADADGQRDVSFASPPGRVAGRVCALTGKRPGDACDHVVTEWFRPGEAPVEPCAAHLLAEVDVRTGRLADAATPARFRRAQLFVDLPARYAAWQARAGLAPLPGTRDAVPADERALSLHITSPRDGQVLLRDADVPGEFATVALEATVDPPVPQVVWYVDGEPFGVADYPYVARWPVRAGEHRIEARVPWRSDAPVATVRVVGR